MKPMCKAKPPRLLPMPNPHNATYNELAERVRLMVAYVANRREFVDEEYKELALLLQLMGNPRLTDVL